MNAKSVIKYILIIFIVVCIAYIGLRESGVLNGNSEPNSAATEQSDWKNFDHYTIVYYFHGNKRCKTCLTIEEYAQEAIVTGFEDNLEKNEMEFRTVNVEEPSNEHFVEDYDLSTRSVVVASYEKGKQTDWVRLDKVWQLVKDHDQFVKYVQEETKKLLVSNGV